jgi:hypothetical protein
MMALLAPVVAHAFMDGVAYALVTLVDFDVGGSDVSGIYRMDSEDGTMKVIADGLNQPTSMEFIGNTAFIVTLGGEIWVVENVASPPFGRGRRH